MVSKASHYVYHQKKNIIKQCGEAISFKIQGKVFWGSKTENKTSPLKPLILICVCSLGTLAIGEELELC